MARIQTLTMNRSGEFKIRTSGNGHCGTDVNQWMQYHLWCQCDVTLDKRGFLFEQLNIDKFFQRLQRTTLSCERLTISCCKKLSTMIRKENPACKIRSIQLTLSPFPYKAGMTYGVSPKV